jgi:MFS family permease
MELHLFVLCALVFTVCSMFTVIAPFYPKRAEQAGVSLALIGLIFSLNPIGNALASIPTGRYLKLIGRRRGILLALGLMVRPSQSITTLMMGLVDFCD